MSTIFAFLLSLLLILYYIKNTILILILLHKIFLKEVFMKLEMFNGWYIFFIVFAIIFVISFYFILKNKSMKTKKIVLGIILFLNLALHFLKLLFPPYNTNPTFGNKDVWFINICAVSVLVFPFAFLSKSDNAKDYMIYMGLLSGGLALLYPEEGLGKMIASFDLIRFYIAHTVIFVVPLLMMLLKVHRLNYKRIWKMPFMVMATMLFIIVNQVLQAELGIIQMRGSDILSNSWKNASLIWRPTDDIGKLFSIFTPDFMKTVPYGAMAGQPKYWPFFWMVPAIFIYFLVFPFLLCMIWEGRTFAKDIKSVFKRKTA